MATEEAIRRGITPKIGKERICFVLANHDLKPWQEEMWCVPAIDAEYVVWMEDVSRLYA